MPILELKINEVGPFFNPINISFDRNINVLVGPNNCGKSTILSVLGDITVCPFAFPRKLLHKDHADFHVKYQLEKDQPKRVSGKLPISRRDEYWANNNRWKRWCSFLDALEYGMFVPAIRQSTDFRAKGSLPERDREAKDNIFIGEYGEDFIKRRKDIKGDFSPNMRKREKASFTSSAHATDDHALIQKIIELDYRAYRQRDSGLRKIVDKIATISSEITEGYQIEFLGVGEDSAGLFPEFRTPDGVMPLNCLSQGTQSIIHTLSSVLFGFAEYYDYPKNLEAQTGILVIDEIDAHLHPTWQRRILATLTRHFPNLQIFCSTHSPIVLGGLKTGQIHLLKRDDSGSIKISRNQTDIRGWSVDEVLRGMLDVAVPTDLATEKLLLRIQELRNRVRLSSKQKAELKRLTTKVNTDLLEGSAVSQFQKLENILMSTPLQGQRKQLHKKPRIISKKQKKK